MLPSDREKKAIQSMSLQENLTLADLRPFWKRFKFDHRRETVEVVDWITRFGIRPVDPTKLFATMSGGNQQKVCVAKWVRMGPDVFVLDEPTQGVDVGGKEEILASLRAMAIDERIAIVLCSSDLDDLAEVCDRVIIFRDGGASEELCGEEVTRERILERTYAN